MVALNETTNQFIHLCVEISANRLKVFAFVWTKKHGCMNVPVTDMAKGV